MAHATISNVAGRGYCFVAYVRIDSALSSARTPESAPAAPTNLPLSLTRMIGHPVALAMLRAGNKRIGERVTVYHLGKPIETEVVKPGFYDPQGERLHGTA